MLVTCRGSSTSVNINHLVVLDCLNEESVKSFGVSNQLFERVDVSIFLSPNIQLAMFLKDRRSSSKSIRWKSRCSRRELFVPMMVLRKLFVSPVNSLRYIFGSKRNQIMKILLTFLVMTLSAISLQAVPKKLLVVTTTTGYRHSSIPTLEKILNQLGNSSGEFTVDFVQQPPNEPKVPNNGATDEEKAAHDKWMASLNAALQKLSPESLKNYDGVVFASTTGHLPLPDPQGFLDWIKDGHAFIGIHAASDTFHDWPAFIDMLGGEFAHHGRQVGVECINDDPSNPATAGLGKTWTITQEEIYQFKSYDPTKVHELLTLNKHPETGAEGHFAVSWCKSYGTGRVFYTSLGHREDISDPDPNLKDRVNSVEISKAYDAHLLGGIEWALGLKK